MNPRSDDPKGRRSDRGRRTVRGRSAQAVFSRTHGRTEWYSRPRVSLLSAPDQKGRQWSLARVSTPSPCAAEPRCRSSGSGPGRCGVGALARRCSAPCRWATATSTPPRSTRRNRSGTCPRRQRVASRGGLPHDQAAARGGARKAGHREEPCGASGRLRRSLAHPLAPSPGQFALALSGDARIPRRGSCAHDRGEQLQHRGNRRPHGCDGRDPRSQSDPLESVPLRPLTTARTRPTRRRPRRVQSAKGEPSRRSRHHRDRSRHQRDAGTVVLRWHIQHRVVVIPKSIDPDRIAKNFDVFNFSLDANSMRRLDDLSSR